MDQLHRAFNAFGAYRPTTTTGNWRQGRLGRAGVGIFLWVFPRVDIRYDDNESFGPHTTWRVAPAFIVPGTETKLKATHGTGFKAPTLTEI